MTWGEFKKAIERQGVEDADRVNYIDWHDDGVFEGPVVKFETTGSFDVT